MEIRYSDDKPGIQNLINIYSCITGKTIEEVEKEFDGKGYGEFKLAVGECVANRLKPLQDRFYELQKDKTYLNSVIKENDEKAAEIVSVDGELENSIVVDSTTTVEPTNHVIKTYGAGAPVSPLTGPDGTTNAPASYSKVLTGKATGYYSKTGKGSSGLGLGYGTVAVDPDVIPYGTKLYITSTDGKFVYGYAVATDTGIAVQKGQILVDLFYETYAESVINGAIQVNVYVVD